MKIEKRGKYPGVKVHLDEKECQELLNWITAPPDLPSSDVPIKFVSKLGTKLESLIEECPTLLQPRTDEEIQHELEVELESAQKKIDALKKGGDWKEIHIK